MQYLWGIEDLKPSHSGDYLFRERKIKHSENTQSNLGSKILSSRTQLLAKLQKQRLSDFILLIIFYSLSRLSTYMIELASKWKHAWWVILFSKQELILSLTSRLILSLTSISVSNEEKFSLFQDSSSCCIQISRHLFLLLEGFRVPNFAQRWIIGWRNNYTGLALQDGQRNVTRSSFCLLGKAAIFPFLQVGCDWDKIRHAMTQNMKNRKTIVWISKPWHKDPNWQQNLLVKIHFSIW